MTASSTPRRCSEPGPVTVRELLAAERLEELDARAATPRALDSVDPEPAARPRPEKIVCIGLNYRSHAAEAGHRAARRPTIFGKFRNALARRGAAVTLPEASEKVDFEAEVAFVIGRPLQPRST